MSHIFRRGFWYCKRAVSLARDFVMMNVFETLTFTVPVLPPHTIHRPSGLILSTPMESSFWYVCMQPFRRTSHIRQVESADPEAKNSPKGWNSRVPMEKEG